MEICFNFQNLLGRLRSGDSEKKRHFRRRLSGPETADRLHQLPGQERHRLHGVLGVEVGRPGDTLRVQHGNEGMRTLLEVDRLERAEGEEEICQREKRTADE